MKKVKDSTVVIFLFTMLIILAFWRSTNKPIQNKGIVQFGNYNDHTFGCNPNTPNQQGCIINQKDWNTQQNIINNPTIATGYYADNTRSTEVVNTLVAKTEDLVKEQRGKPFELTDKTHFSDLAENLFLPTDDNNDIRVKKSEIDMRDMSIDKWRTESDKKSNQGIISDLREYQQEYNEGVQQNNKFKKMSIEEHRKQNIAEWEEKIRKSTDEMLQTR